jgi:nicotinamide-nucleotide amidase
MKAILLDSVLPELKKRFFLPFILHRTIMTQGLPESYMAQRLQDFEKQLPPGFSLAYLPSYGGVRLRISASGKNRQELEHLVDTQVQLVLNTIRPFVMDMMKKPSGSYWENSSGKENVSCSG